MKDLEKLIELWNLCERMVEAMGEASSMQEELILQVFYLARIQEILEK